MITENANRLGSFRSEPEYRGLLLDASKPSLYVLPGAEVKPSVKFDDATLVKDPCGYELSVTSPCVLFLCIEPVMLGPNITGNFKGTRPYGAAETGAIRIASDGLSAVSSGGYQGAQYELDASKDNASYSGSYLQVHSARAFSCLKF